jgi:hypothetical protein
MKHGGFVEGERSQRFKIFRADLAGNSVGEPLAEFDTVEEVLNYRRRADYRYVVYDRRTPYDWLAFQRWAQDQT